ncbi:MAG: phosphatase [Bacteroidales bacterium]
MKEIYPNLHIGSQDDYENIVKYQDGWFVIHACKEPYHRQTLGYSGRSAPKEHPEYLIAYRGNHLILNLVDAPDPAYISKQIIDEAIKAICINIVNLKVFVHCNQGQSRSAVIGLLYLHHIRAIAENFIDAETEYLVLYPWYSPASGMKLFAMQNWSNY